MNGPQEIERKFKVTNFEPRLIPPGAECIAIEQVYLLSDGAIGRRIRKWTANGATRYFYTEKQSTDTPGVRIEREREIAEHEYAALLLERDPALATIGKDRYRFPYHGKIYELDIFTQGQPSREGIVLLEVELNDIAEEVVIPPGWQVVEVTMDARFDNYSLAAS